MELTYRKVGDVYLPNLEVDEDPRELRKWGRRRMRYLKEHRSGTYSIMLMEDTLMKHVLDLQEDAERMEERLIQQMKEKEGITEELKRQDMMKWVGMMNNIKAAAEEIVSKELIYI